MTSRTNDTEHHPPEGPDPSPGIICMIVVICGSGVRDCDNCNPTDNGSTQWPGANEGRGLTLRSHSQEAIKYHIELPETWSAY